MVDINKIRTESIVQSLLNNSERVEIIERVEFASSEKKMIRHNLGRPPRVIEVRPPAGGSSDFRFSSYAPPNEEYIFIESVNPGTMDIILKG